MESAPVPFQKIVFVCVNRRDDGRSCCAAADSEAIAAELKARITAMGLAGRVRVSKSGCQDLCAQGPNIMLFPDGVWYRGVREADLERIVHDIAGSLAPHAARP